MRSLNFAHAGHQQRFSDGAQLGGLDDLAGVQGGVGQVVEKLLFGDRNKLETCAAQICPMRIDVLPLGRVAADLDLIDADGDNRARADIGAAPLPAAAPDSPPILKSPCLIVALRRAWRAAPATHRAVPAGSRKSSP